MNSRKLNADDFRKMIVASLPEMGHLLATPDVKAHSDARALMEFSGRAMEAGDIQLTVRILTLAKQLVEVENELEFYTHNALWTEFFGPIRRYEQISLKIFRQIDPHLRKQLYWPFTIPRTFFETEVLPSATSNGVAHTIAKVAQERARDIRQNSSVGYFADVTLSLSPHMPDPRLIFVDEIPAERNAPLWLVETVRDEIRRRVSNLSDGGVALVGVKIALVDTIVHPVDTRRSDVGRTSGEAFDRCLEKAVLTKLR